MVNISTTNENIWLENKKEKKNNNNTNNTHTHKKTRLNHTWNFHFHLKHMKGAITLKRIQVELCYLSHIWPLSLKVSPTCTTFNNSTFTNGVKGESPCGSRSQTTNRTTTVQVPVACLGKRAEPHLQVIKGDWKGWKGPHSYKQFTFVLRWVFCKVCILLETFRFILGAMWPVLHWWYLKPIKAKP